MQIKILGTGCAKCKSLEEFTRRAVEELELSATVEKVEDIQQIMSYGILSTPGLVVNDQVILSGYLPRTREIKDLLSKIEKS